MTQSLQNKQKQKTKRLLNFGTYILKKERITRHRNGVGLKLIDLNLNSLSNFQMLIQIRSVTCRVLNN